VTITSERKPARPARVIPLTAEDKKLVAYVHAYRQAKGIGPTWSETRAAVGITPLRPWKDFTDQAREELGPDATSGEVSQRAHWLYRSTQKPDPLGPWLLRLRVAGALRYSQTARSLDVTPKVAAAIRGKGTP
jgi:hypothetical protein